MIESSLVQIEQDPSGRGRVLRSSNISEAMATLCSDTCDLPTSTDVAQNQCDARSYCAPLAEAGGLWGHCTECNCAWGSSGRVASCTDEGVCVCWWPASGPDCSGGMSSEEFKAWGITVGVVFLFFLFVLGTLAYVRVVTSTRSLLLLRSTGKPPMLDVLPSQAMQGLTYHLFLSHVWSSGQDQVAVIKRRILEMLPRTRVSSTCDRTLSPRPR